jgi:hypothetical protein
MKMPNISFNTWIVSKIANYMTNKEGCVIENIGDTNQGCQVILQDTFGYRYQVNISLLGRVYDSGAGPDYILAERDT